jgi:hypothetical protein
MMIRIVAAICLLLIPSLRATRSLAIPLTGDGKSSKSKICATTAPRPAALGRASDRSIVVEKGSCYVQIMSSDVPAFTGTTPTGDQMKAMQTSKYIAYTGPCTVDEAKGSVKLKVEAAWTANYVGTEQERFFRFENGKLLFGTAPNSIRLGNDDCREGSRSSV